MFGSVELLRKVFRLVSVLLRLEPILTWLPVAPDVTNVTVVPFTVMVEPFVGLVVNVTEPLALPMTLIVPVLVTAPVSAPNPEIVPELLIPELASLRAPPVVPTPR